MARIRTIKPKFWDDQKIVKISIESRLTFIALWNFADDNGVIIGENVWLKSKIFPHEEIKIKKFSSWIQEMVDISLIIPVIFRKNYFYLLPNFQKHQIINRPNLEDVFIPTNELEKLLKNSENNHGLITDNSMPYRKGEEGKVKDSRGEDAPKPKKIIDEKLFKDSEFFDYEKFERSFDNTEYEIFNLKFYYQAVLNWSEGKGAKKKDWIATARNFILKDIQDKKAVLKTDNLKENGIKSTGSTNIKGQQSVDGVSAFNKFNQLNNVAPGKV